MIKLIKSTFFEEKKTKKLLSEFIESTDILSMNSTCKEFEEKFSLYQQRKYSVMFNSGSSANLALIQSIMNLGLVNKKDLIGFSALTWATNVMPAMQLGLSPVPIDVSMTNLNVTSEKLLEVLKKNDVKVLFLTNLLGFCGDIDRIAELCKERNILFLEDNCESLGSEFNGKKLGNFGLASTFSFFVGHHLSTIEGGMVCTDDKKLYDMLLMVRAHGWDRNIDAETQVELRKEHHIDNFYSKYAFYDLGYNFRPTEINGFLGVNQLEYISKITKRREEIFHKYQEAVQSNDNILKLDLSHMSLVSNFAFPIVFDDEQTFNTYKERFEKAEIEIRPIVGGSMTEQPFFKKYVSSFDSCDTSSKIHKTGFYIPNNPDLTDEEVSTMCDLLRK